MRINLLITVLSFTLLVGCKTQTLTITKEKSKSETVTKPLKEYSILAVLWQQHAAEYRALTYQAFNTAKIQLDKILDNTIKNIKPLAIVTDIDESVLNNSAYNG